MPAKRVVSNTPRVSDWAGLLEEGPSVAKRIGRASACWAWPCAAGKAAVLLKTPHQVQRLGYGGNNPNALMPELARTSKGVQSKSLI